MPRKPTTLDLTIPGTRYTPVELMRAAIALGERTRDAYSADRYRSWRAVAEKLLRAGYTEREAETIMRSKITRWAADSAGGARYGHVPAHIVPTYAKRFFAGSPERLSDWVLATLGSEQETD